MAELNLPPGVVGCANFEAICFAVSTDVSMPSTCRHQVMCVNPMLNPMLNPVLNPVLNPMLNPEHALQLKHQLMSKPYAY